MRRFIRSPRNAAIATWLLTLCGIAHAQDPVDARSPKPVMMLLVDTSGSMERLPNTVTQNDVLPDCAAGEKNRWSVTLEALTGDFQNFSCTQVDRSTLSTSEYDYGYYLPHYRPSFTAQSATGILDVYAQRSKFGLMTFDAAATYTDGAAFVAYDTLRRDSDNRGQRGMYSYGDVRKLVFPGCGAVYGIDNGARNTNATSGQLVAPSSSDDVDDLRSTNEQIQRALVGSSENGYEDGIRPYGGTPTAALLSDLVQFMDDDPSVSTADPYHACRERFAILITDGVPDSDYRDDRFRCDSPNSWCQASAVGEDCHCPYDYDYNYASQLCGSLSDGKCQGGSLNGLYVVALSLRDDADAVARLNLIAEAGGTTEAVLADDVGQLAAALSKIMNRDPADATSRTSPIVQVSGLNAQYELTAGFRIPEDDSTWQGVLERQRWECDGTTPKRVPLSNDGTPKDRLHEALDSQTTRNIQVLNVPVANAYDIVHSPYVDDMDADGYQGDTVNRRGVSNLVAADTSSRPYGLNTLTGTVPNDLDGTLSHEDRRAMLGTLSDLTGDGNVTDEDYDYAVNWLSGESSAGRTTKLGAIYHSQPVVVAPLIADTTNDSLNQFLGTLADQPEAVIVATADGLLHAFSLELETFPAVTDASAGEAILGLDAGALAVPQVEPGEELWAIAPPAALASVGSAASSTQLLFDGAPIVRNVTLKRRVGSADATSYRRVLVAALRGLPAVVAFDITNITQPKFMWQYTHPMMGETVGQPAVAQLAVQWNDGVAYERAVALIPGGSGETNTTCDAGGVGRPSNVRSSGFRCWKQRGRALYAVDIATGSLLQVFDHNVFPAPLTGGLGVDASNLGVTAHAGYVTDADGILYRIDFSSSMPSEWSVQPVWDLFHGTTDGGRASVYPPLLQEGPSGEWVVVVGTGDVDNLTDSAAHRVVSMTETFNFGRTSLFTGVTMEQNWEVQLDAGESVTGPIVKFDDVVYFASFRAVTDPTNLCMPGESRIWGLDYRENDEGNAIGELLDPSTPDGEPLRYFDQGVSGYEWLGSNLLVGVSIAQEPTCVESLGVFDTFLGTRSVPSGRIGGGTFSLRAIVSGGAGTKADGSAIAQASIAIPQPDTSAMRVPGGFGSYLE